MLPGQYLCGGKSGSRRAESLRRSCNGIKGKQRDKKEECLRQLKKVAAPPSRVLVCKKSRTDFFVPPLARPHGSCCDFFRLKLHLGLWLFFGLCVLRFYGFLLRLFLHEQFSLSIPRRTIPDAEIRSSPDKLNSPRSSNTAPRKPEVLGVNDAT